MWRKSEDSKPKSSPRASPSLVSTVQHPGNAVPQDAAGTPSDLNQGIKIKGEIFGHGDLFLDGEFKGKICLASGTFTIGPNARVSAEIEVPEVIIRGEVIGTLKACGRVHIESTGKLTGDMETSAVVIEDGAVLNSNVAVPQAAAPEVSASEIDQPAQRSSPEPLPRAKGAGAS